jgi:hypothetical protein
VLERRFEDVVELVGDGEALAHARVPAVDRDMPQTILPVRHAGEPAELAALYLDPGQLADDSLGHRGLVLVLDTTVHPVAAASGVS